MIAPLRKKTLGVLLYQSLAYEENIITIINYNRVMSDNLKKAN